MKFFEYLYYRMYEAYTKKNDSPVMRTFMYLTLVQFLIVGVILVYLEQGLIIGNALSKTQIENVKHSSIFWIVIILSIFLFTYLRFTKKDFSYYEQRYSKFHSLDKSIKMWMLVAFPLLFFFLSIFLIAPLFGGEIFGKEINGLFGK